MAVTVHVAGLATVKMNLGEDNTMLTFGYTQDGANITFQPFWQDIPGDENGGDAGPPIDKVWMGEIAQVQLDFTKWETTYAQTLSKRLRDAAGTYTVGQPRAAGTLTFTNALCLTLSAPNDVYTFPRAIPESAIQLNVGTKYSRLSVSFTCYKSTAGVLWVGTDAYYAP
jgi:hypothetical protein